MCAWRKVRRGEREGHGDAGCGRRQAECVGEQCVGRLCRVRGGQRGQLVVRRAEVLLWTWLVTQAAAGGQFQYTVLLTFVSYR